MLQNKMKKKKEKKMYFFLNKFFLMSLAQTKMKLEAETLRVSSTLLRRKQKGQCTTDHYTKEHRGWGVYANEQHSSERWSLTDSPLTGGSKTKMKRRKKERKKERKEGRKRKLKV